MFYRRVNGDTEVRDSAWSRTASVRESSFHVGPSAFAADALRLSDVLPPVAYFVSLFLLKKWFLLSLNIGVNHCNTQRT